MSGYTRTQTPESLESLHTARSNLKNQPQRVSPEGTSSRWPEVRISRLVNRNTGSARKLREFVDDLGERNDGLGNARALGSMACTFIDAKTMGLMFDAKFSSWGTDRKQAKKTVRSFSKYFNGYVRHQEKQRIDAEYERLQTLNGCVSGDCDPDQDDLLSRLDEDFVMQYPKKDDLHIMRWNMASFDFKKTLTPFGTHRMAFDLTGNDQLFQEFEDTLEFLKGERLDTNFVTRNRRGERRLFMPHVVVFDCFDAAENVELVAKESMPEHISLHAPSAKISNI